MTTVTELIVLHHTKTGDNSVVIHTLGRDFGRKSFFVRGIGKNALTTMLLPMNILECGISENRRSDLSTASRPVMVYPLAGIRDSMFKNSITMFMSEVLYRVLKEGTEEPGLYAWCRESILLLDAMESDFSNFHIRFLLELASALGFRPSSEDIAPFAGNLMPVIDRFIKEPFSRTMLIPLNGKTRGEIAEAVLKYIGYHMESQLNINSLKVLHEILC